MARFTTETGKPTTINPEWVVATQPAIDAKGTPVIGITNVLLGIPGMVSINVRASHDDTDQALGLTEKKESKLV